MRTREIGTTAREVAHRATTTLRRAAEDAELRVLAAEGRRSLHAKATTARVVGRKALRTGVVTGVVAAAAVVVREIRKRRRLAR